MPPLMPPPSPQSPHSHQAEIIISDLLRIGVSLSLAIVVTGAIISFVHHPDYLSGPQTLARLTKPGAAAPHTLRGVLAGLSEMRGQSIVTLGLILLIATPVFRVAVSIGVFIYQRDRRYVAITSLVLALLLLSFFLGAAEG